jgi:glycosyltransferase involved in cell wall biosynthesis
MIVKDSMKILVITNLFPNKLEPTKATFNKQQLYHLSKLCELKVIAPVPWAPPIHFIKNWKYLRNIPYHEIIDGLDVLHPRYFVIPKIGRSLYGFLFLASIFKHVRRSRDEFNFNCIFALWAYPDGFASVLIAKILKKPILIQILGSDINHYVDYYLRRKMIYYTLKNSDAVTAVSNALKKRVIDIGIPEEKVTFNPNGVDTAKFYPSDKYETQKRLNLPQKKYIILFVGNLVSVKGISYLLEALHIIKNDFDKNILLIIIGDGILKNNLENQVKRLELIENVEFKGVRPHNEIPFWMNASDLLCLPSLNEGMPNVVLEALACGKPVVATNVGGIPEIIQNEKNGILVKPCDPEQLADAISKVLTTNWNHFDIARSVEKYSWESSAKRIYDILSKISLQNNQKY